MKQHLAAFIAGVILLIGAAYSLEGKKTKRHNPKFYPATLEAICKQ